MLLFWFFMIGAGLAIGPWFAGEWLSLPTKAVLSLLGAAVLIVNAVLGVITRLYRKTSANMAYVRTGMGGARVVKDGGATVLPVVHQVIPVSLETMRLNVERRGPHALITRDNLRVDLSAEFYIKVQPVADDILQAARSLGNRSVSAGAVSELVQEKLVSALRTVAATKDLVELHSKRDEFASAVQAILTHDLASNGLTLESVTISSLDQTDPTQLQAQNVFDAQGLRKIAEITQNARVQRNEIEREAERHLVAKDVSTRKQVLELQREQAEFEAAQRAQVANVQAARQREMKQFAIEQEEKVARREIEKQQAIQTAEVQRNLVVEQAEVEKRITLVAKLRDQETAEIQKRQSIEMAERAKEIAVAEQEKERAAAQAAMLAAEAEREASNQRVLTVKVTHEAQREAEKKLIAAEQAIKEVRIREQTEADVLAYMAVKQAEGERQAADLQCEARLRLAEADAQAAVRRAAGLKAEQMVPVEVERERVELERARAEVERQRLANQQEFDEAALKFELEKLRIEADRDVRGQTATAMGNLLQGAHVQLFGDPSTMGQMMQHFTRASGLGLAADGFFQSLSPTTRQALQAVGGSLGEAFGLTPPVAAEVKEKAPTAAIAVHEGNGAEEVAGVR